MIRAQMAKWLRDYLSFGGRRPPPQPPTPDYTESDILRAYREQKNLDFEDPYEDADSRPEPDPAGPGDAKYDSPKHRLIKVEAAEMARAKVLLGSAGEEVSGQVSQAGWSQETGPLDTGERFKCVTLGAGQGASWMLPSPPSAGRGVGYLSLFRAQLWWHLPALSPVRPLCSAPPVPFPQPSSFPLGSWRTPPQTDLRDPLPCRALNFLTAVSAISGNRPTDEERSDLPKVTGR